MRYAEDAAMQKENYGLRMEETIRALNGARPRLLLHVCCAPCASGALDELCAAFRVACFFYNPNISPREEFDKRFAELARLTRAMPLFEAPEVLLGAYDGERFDALARGLEDAKEGGERCFRCYELRLAETAREAKARGFEYFTTTLSISPYKNAAKLNQLGGEIAEKYGLTYLYSDFKKKGGYQRSIERSKEYALYRQDYCGCVYSKAAAERKKAARQTP